MVSLKPALEERGFEVAVFHATGMGRRAFESLAGEGAFAVVLDFAPQELGNHIMGSTMSAGPVRMANAGASGTPQMISIGCYDLVDFIGWQDVPPKLAGQEVHAHNRLLSSVMMTPDQWREMAQAMCRQLSDAKGPANLILPLQGGNEWDRPGGPLHDAEGLAAFVDEIRTHCPDNVTLIELDSHINDSAFSDRVLADFDAWVAAGIIAP